MFTEYSHYAILYIHNRDIYLLKHRVFSLRFQVDLLFGQGIIELETSSKHSSVHKSAYLVLSLVR